MRKSDTKRVDPKGRNPFDVLLSPTQVAERKQVSQASVIRAIVEGRLPAWEKSGVYFIPERELEKWVPVRGRGKKPKEETP